MKRKSGESGKPDRKTIEKNRRIHMKGLLFELASLIPAHRFNCTSKQELLERAAIYIKQLRDRIEELKEKKEQAMNSLQSSDNNCNNIINGVCKQGIVRSNFLPVVELREMGSAIEVALISGLNRNFRLYEVMNVLQEEGADVVSVNSSTVGAMIFHTIHSQVRISRFGVETTTLRQKLQELVY